MVRHSNTKAKILKRKNFLPTLLITILLWTSIAFVVYFLDPSTLVAIPLFFILIFLAFLFTFSLLMANSRRGLIITISLVFFLILRYLGVGNLINIILIIGLAVCTELYFAIK